MTAKEFFKEMKIDSKSGIATYIYGSKKKINAIKKMVDDFETYSKCDFEIGVIDENRYNKEIEMVRIMRIAIDAADII